MNLTRENLTIPNPDPKGEMYIKYDMRRVFEAEARIEEISFVSSTKAPELLTKFSLAMKDLGEHLADLGYRESVAKRKMRERRAVVVMEVIPSKLAEKKLSNNDTNREAVIELDPEYSAATDVLNQIEASFVLVREKLRGIESAINSTKKVLDTLPSWTPNINLPVQPNQPYTTPYVVPFVQPATPYITPPYEITCTPDPTMTVGKVMEDYMGVKGAATDPKFDYVRPEAPVVPQTRPPAPTTTRFQIGKAKI